MASQVYMALEVKVPLQLLMPESLIDYLKDMDTGSL